MKGPSLLQAAAKTKKASLLQTQDMVVSSIEDLLAATTRMRNGGGAAAHTMSALQEDANAIAERLHGDDKTHLSGIDKEQLKAVRDSIDSTLFKNLWNFSKEDQAEVHSDHAVLTECGTAQRAAVDGDLAVVFSSLLIKK